MTTSVHGSGSVYLWYYGFSGLDVVHSTNGIYLTSSSLSQPTHVQYLYRAVMNDSGHDSGVWRTLETPQGENML